MTTANQISGYTYDPSGNLTVIPGTGGATYTYNGESELTTTTAGVNYTYDGDGQRVEKNNGTLFWYGMGGEVLEETGLTGGFMEDYVFFGGQRVARMDSSKDIFAYFEDHLGTARVMQKIVAGASTSTLVYDADFRPFGRESILTQTGNPLYKFDGKRRDTESNLDDFGARYYSFTIGRFMSADWSAVPAPVPYANLTNPQTLNLYAMVADNPETFADLDGHVGAEGAAESSDELEESGEPADCARLLGCAEYLVEYADGPLDTSQAENNAEARDDATVDGTTTQENPPPQAPPPQQQDSNKEQPNQPNQQPSSWDKTKPLPDDPTKLGPDWKKNPQHQDPNGEQHINDKTGEKLEWNKGRPGKPGNRGKDHWHYTPPGGERGRDHFKPGETVKKVGIVAAIATVVHFIIDTAPEWAPFAIP